MSKIDINKPLQLADGRKAYYRDKDTDAGTIEVYVEGDTVSVGARLFNSETGRHWYGVLPDLMNVPETSWSGRSLQTRDGKQARYIGTSDDGQPLFEIVYDYMTRFNGKGVAIERRQPDGRVSSTPGRECGDDIVDAALREVVTFHNIYADGTVGSTEHLTYRAAYSRSKFGKLRVGILKTTKVSGKLVGSEVLRTVAMLRTASGATYPFQK